jgi:excisionase family DNA binding protein
MRLLGVREAARELGVHENTLRRWEEAGIVRAVRLPSGVRRFRPEEVESLQRQMYDDQATAARRELPVPQPDVATPSVVPAAAAPRSPQPDDEGLAAPRPVPSTSSTGELSRRPVRNALAGIRNRLRS